MIDGNWRLEAYTLYFEYFAFLLFVTFRQILSNWDIPTSFCPTILYASIRSHILPVFCKTMRELYILLGHMIVRHFCIKFWHIKTTFSRAVSCSSNSLQDHLSNLPSDRTILCVTFRHFAEPYNIQTTFYQTLLQSATFILNCAISKQSFALSYFRHYYFISF